METIVTNIGQLVTPRGTTPLGGERMKEISIHEGVDLLIDAGRVASIRPGIDRGEACQVIDAAGGVILPGLVDPHTHAVFAGTREEEFLARAQGIPYDGGGIRVTSQAVATASEDEIVGHSLPFINSMLSWGTTTVEIKSGYGLSLEGELKLLRAIRQLKRTVPLTVVPTFLGAHAFPIGVNRADYISSIITEMIPAVRGHRLAQFCDIFCDEGFYTIAESRTILRAARGAGLRLKLHADELAPLGGAELAAELGATSADHLLQVSEKGMRLMKSAGVIPVILPGTAFTLGHPYAPARTMIELGLPVALASDFNPGSCLINSMFIIIGLAVMKMGLSIEEAITAATLNAACALELSGEIGTLEEGKAADLIILELETYRQIPYFFGHNPVRSVIKGGKLVYDSRSCGSLHLPN